MQDKRNSTCPFCAIIRGQRAADVVYVLGDFSVFRPLNRQLGKVLIVPHGHYERLADMPEDVRAAWMHAFMQVSVLLNAAAYRVQISCGSEAQNVRHLYAQFSYQVAEAACPVAS